MKLPSSNIHAGRVAKGGNQCQDFQRVPYQHGGETRTGRRIEKGYEDRHRGSVERERGSIMGLPK
jgi:hypothetical protein